MPKSIHVQEKAEIGIPHAEANGDGSVTCPTCETRIHPDPNLLFTDSDYLAKAVGAAYAHHYVRQHSD